MENIKQLDNTNKVLDLREWWKEIEEKDVEKIINKKDKWNYWWFNEDKKQISTLEGWKITSYKTDETEILFKISFMKDSDKISNINQETKSDVLMDLFLSPENRVKDTAEAYEKSRYSNKIPIFWFISKWKWNKAVIVLDFSEWKKPKRTVYPLNKYNLKMKAVKI